MGQVHRRGAERGGHWRARHRQETSGDSHREKVGSCTATFPLAGAPVGLRSVPLTLGVKLPKMGFCNAKNHPLKCTCGFGGAKASSSTMKRHSETPDLFDLPRVPRHYTKQKERCPFCNAPVFFHQLGNLGRVYFDEPGPPWPKHPCTDKASSSYRGPFGSGNEGWLELAQMSVDAVSDNVLRFAGKLDSQDCVVFVGSSTFRNTHQSSICLSGSTVQVHRRGGNFDLALLTPDLEHMLLTGYATLAEADGAQM